MIFFNLGLLKPPRPVQPDPLERHREPLSPTAAPTPFLHQQHPCDSPSSTACRQQGLDRQIPAAFSTRHQHSSARNPNTALVPAGHGPALTSPALPGSRRVEELSLHSLGTSQLLLDCWLQKSSFLFLLPQISH